MGEGASHQHYGGLTEGVLVYVGGVGFQASYMRVKPCMAEKNINADNDLSAGFAVS